jgi:HPt (histidine-containing phosphotransfer) domain-containing protein
MQRPLVKTETVQSLANMGAMIGNDNYFKSIFDTFQESFQADLNQIKRYLDEGLTDQVRILAHRMKSSARTVGAEALGEEFYSIENQIVSGDPDLAAIKAKLPEIDQLYVETLEGFRDYLH